MSFLQQSGWRDSNPHALRHQILSLACLPVPAHPESQGFTLLAYESPITMDRWVKCLCNFLTTLTSICNDFIGLTLDDFISFQMLIIHPIFIYFHQCKLPYPKPLWGRVELNHCLWIFSPLYNNHLYDSPIKFHIVKDLNLVLGMGFEPMSHA